jgi:hypothetical protein
MPTIYERHQSRPFTIDARTASLTRTWFVQGTNDETEVQELVLTASSVVFDFLVRKSVRCEPIGGGNWFCDVEYANIDPQQAVGAETVTEPTAPSVTAPLGPAFSFDTTGGTTHITQSRSTRSKTRAGGGAAPDNKLAIGITKDRVEGCDVVTPKFEWQLECQRADCTGQYLIDLFSVTGTVNYDATFYGFPAGTVLYLGASGRYTFNDRWTITHRFACNPNEVNLDVGNGITVPEKKGWDYLWIGYKDEVSNNKLIQVPDTAYVEVVYRTGNFDLLGIGG